MEKIHINTDVLAKKIQKLEELKEQCLNVNACAQDVQASGASMDALCNMDMEYVVVKEKICALLDNSILFFGNVRNSVLEADDLSVTMIKGGDL